MITQPSTSRRVPIVIEYDVRFDPQYKRVLIRFLEKLQRDTGGGRENSFGIDPHTVYIQWEQLVFTRIGYGSIPLITGFPE